MFPVLLIAAGAKVRSDESPAPDRTCMSGALLDLLIVLPCNFSCALVPITMKSGAVPVSVIWL